MTPPADRIISRQETFQAARVFPGGPLLITRDNFAHPAGNIDISLRRVSINGIAATIFLPGGVSGEFVWARDRIALSLGTHEFEV